MKEAKYRIFIPHEFKLSSEEQNFEFNVFNTKVWS